MENIDLKHSHLMGREFDWFALDKSGAIAMFSTAGRGIIPIEVKENYQAYDAISDSIETPKWGTSEVFDVYADLGLYVFDWKLNMGPYKKVKAAENALDTALKSKILEINKLPKLDLFFSDTTKILDIDF